MPTNARHETESLKVGGMPKNTRSMTAAQIVAYMQKHFKEKQDKEGRFVPANKATAYLIATMNTYSDPDNWKSPFYARFPESAEWLSAAIIWYHGAEAYRTFVGVGSNGYAC